MSNAHNQIDPRPTDACAKLCVINNGLLEIDNTQWWINHLTTKAIAFGPGKNRPSIFLSLFLLQVTNDLSPKIYQI